MAWELEYFLQGIREHFSVERDETTPDVQFLQGFVDADALIQEVVRN